VRNPHPPQQSAQLVDHGPNPFIVDIDKETEKNYDYKKSLWVGHYLKATLMNLPVGHELGLDMHPNADLYIRIEDGDAKVQIGNTKENLYLSQHIDDDFSIFVPAGTWFNLANTGEKPLKLNVISTLSHKHNV